MRSFTMECLDLDILRSLVLLHDMGSLARAAQAQGRTQSALSLQLARLEERVGSTIFCKQGRRLVLTPEGQVLLAQARKLLDLNDDTFRLVRSNAVHGKVGLGVPQDVAESWLPDVLAGFGATHPQVEIAVRVGRSVRLVEDFKAGRLQLVLFWGKGDLLAGARRVARYPMAWMGTGSRTEWPSPLPLVVYDGPCIFRKAAEVALRKAKIPYRIAFASTSPSGIWAAVAAGLGVTVRIAMGCPKRVQSVDLPKRLPGLPHVELHIASTNPISPPVRRLQELLLKHVVTGATNP